MNQKAFQDYWEKNQCWGCGCGNEHGLHLKSYWTGDESVSKFIPSEYHKAGPDNILNGGIIATIIDCHSICTAIADAYRQENREPDREPFIWYVTASMKIDYHRPTLLYEPVILRARVQRREGRKTVVVCEVQSNEKRSAQAEVLAVRIEPDKWYA